MSGLSGYQMILMAKIDAEQYGSDLFGKKFSKTPTDSQVRYVYDNGIHQSLNEVANGKSHRVYSFGVPNPSPEIECNNFKKAKA